MSRLVVVVAVGLSAAAGCGPTYGVKRPDPIDVTAKVTGPDGKPLPATLVVILQPIGDQNPARLTRQANGAFAGKAMPGKYLYSIALAKGDDPDPPKGIPEKYTSPSQETTVEVQSGKTLEITISK